MFTVHCTTQYNLLPYLILRMLSHSIAFSIFSSCFPFNIIIIITTAIWLWHSHTYTREYARTRETKKNSFQCLLSAFECDGIQQQQQRPYVCTMQLCRECVRAYKVNTEAEHMRHHVLVLNINDSGCWVCVRTSVCSRGRESERASLWVCECIKISIGDLFHDVCHSARDYVTFHGKSVFRHSYATGAKLQIQAAHRRRWEKLSKYCLLVRINWLRLLSLSSCSLKFLPLKIWTKYSIRHSHVQNPLFCCCCCLLLSLTTWLRIPERMPL